MIWTLSKFTYICPKTIRHEHKIPHTIENCVGEKINFLSIETNQSDDKVLLEAFCNPGCGPIMHTHLRQDECLTVTSGKMGYQIPGQEPKFLIKGETALFKRGTPHKFWAEGKETLKLSGWISPVDNVIFYLSALYAAQNKSGKGQPETFDGAYLMTRYTAEYDIPEIPQFVKNIIMPFTCFIGSLLGKYKHFRNAPLPLK